MLTKTLTASLLFLAIFCYLPIPAFAQKRQVSVTADEVFRLVNKHRTDKGLKPLKQNDAIAKVAEGHSRNMASKRVDFGHDGFDERIVMVEKKTKKTRASAENVAYSTRDAKAVVSMWLKSEGHRENIEGDYTTSGIGMAKGSDGQVYYTQIFVKY